MRILRQFRPSPALIVAATALTLAVAGTAIAGPQAIISALTKKDKKTVRKIADGEINKKAGGLSVASAASATSAKVATDLGYAHRFNITTGANAPNGQDFLTIGPFTFDVLCDINNAGSDIATIEVRSSQDHASLDAGPQVNDMTAGTKYQVRSQSGSTGTLIFEANFSNGGGFAPDGTAFTQGPIVIGINGPGQLGKCHFAGLLSGAL